MADKITIGSVNIYGVSDGARGHRLRIDELFPSEQALDWEEYRRSYPNTFVDSNTWLEEFGCYLIVSQGRNVLVDTGIGSAEAPFAKRMEMAGQLLNKLQAQGI